MPDTTLVSVNPVSPMYCPLSLVFLASGFVFQLISKLAWTELEGK